MALISSPQKKTYCSTVNCTYKGNQFNDDTTNSKSRGEGSMIYAIIWDTIRYDTILYNTVCCAIWYTNMPNRTSYNTDGTKRKWAYNWAHNWAYVWEYNWAYNWRHSMSLRIQMRIRCAESSLKNAIKRTPSEHDQLESRQAIK